MELGGSDAFIVLEDADLEKTVKWAVWAKMNNTGQCCVKSLENDSLSPKNWRIKFLEQFQAALAALQPGDPMDPATTLGPLSTEGALIQLLGQIKGAVAKGAKVVMGGNRIDRPGSYMEPTILTNIRPGNPAYREEFFGPVALLFRVKNADEAIVLANDSDFGLGGSALTPKRRRLWQARGGTAGYGHGFYQSPDVDGLGFALRRDQKFRLRTRTFPPGHPGVCE